MSGLVNISKILIDGAVLSILASLSLIGILRFNPRLFLQDYPEDIQNLAPPKTKIEKRQSLIVGIPFLVLLLAVPFISTMTLKHASGGTFSIFALFINAFGVVFFFNIVDLLFLDWLIFSFLTPSFVIIPGTEGMEGYKDYGYHFRAFLKGSILSVIAGLLIAGIVTLL
jgi:hypothetical protein